MNELDPNTLIAQLQDIWYKEIPLSKRDELVRAAIIRSISLLSAIHMLFRLKLLRQNLFAQITVFFLLLLFFITVLVY